MLFIFDMGGVCCNTWTPDAVCNFLKISVDQFKQINHADEKNIYGLLSCGIITAEDYWKTFKERAQKLGISLREFDYDLFPAFFHPQLDMLTIKIINKLKKKHRVVCGTNTIEGHYRNHLERGDYAVFDQTYASNFINAKKPDSMFWQKIIDAEGAYMTDVFFIDDRIENVEAADAMGMTAIQFTDAKTLYRLLKKYF
ncbi:MAG: HAD-IA family hydrolase [Treponema sp.]|nr:HAD-IA family hydrolase [Treponema sp.]